MSEANTTELFKGKDGSRLAEIEKGSNGKYLLWKIDRREISPSGNRHSLLGEYLDLVTARAKAKMIVVRFEQDQDES